MMMIMSAICIIVLISMRFKVIIIIPCKSTNNNKIMAKIAIRYIVQINHCHVKQGVVGPKCRDWRQQKT